MLYREIFAVSSEIRTKWTHSLYLMIMVIASSPLLVITNSEF
jgi:hypothetical protein